MKLISSLEALCSRCGLCCYQKSKSNSGEVYINPFVPCDWLTEFGCIDYKNRKCLPVTAMTAGDYVLPEVCNYKQLRTGLKFARVISKEDYLISLKKEKGGRTKQSMV